MPHHVKRIARTTGAKSATYAGPAGELVMDITNNDLVLQNGQAGGVRLAKASTVIDATNGVNITTGGTLGDTTVVSGVDASTAAKGVVQLSNATDGTSQAMAATPKAVSDALQAAKDYADTAAGLPYTGTAPIAVDANNRVISVTNATTSAKGVMQVGDNMTVNNGVVSVKPWAVHSATAAAVDVNDVQEGALIQTDEPVGGDLTAVIAQVETGTTLSGSPSVVPSSYTVVSSLGAPIYVNASTGSDTNNGATAATAVKTITHALELAAQRVYSDDATQSARIYVAGGTYNENVEVINSHIRLDLLGNAVITGDITVDQGSHVRFLGDFTLTTGSWLVFRESGVYIGTQSLSVTGDIYVWGGSFAEFAPVVSIARGSTTKTRAITVVGSIAVFRKSVSIQSTGYSDVVFSYNGGQLAFDADVTLSGRQTQRAVYANGNATMFFAAALTVYSAATGAYSAVECLLNSEIVFSGVTRVTGSSGYTGVLVSSTINSSVYMGLYSSLALAGPALNAVRVSNGGSAAIQNTYSVTGTFSRPIHEAVLNGRITVDAGTAISGSPTGARFMVGTGAQINVGGAGLNRLPGSTAGTASTASFGYYA